MLSERAINVLLPLTTGYLSESGFSAKTAIETKYRNSMNVPNDLRLCLSQVKPRIDKLVSNMQAHTSHYYCCGFGDATTHLLGMLPRAAERFIVFTCAAAQFNVLPRTPWCRARRNTSLTSSVQPRSSPCCRALHGSARSSTPRRLWLCGRAVLLPPRSSTCFRALHGAARGRKPRRLRLCCRAVLRAAAQVYVLPRTMVTRAAERFVVFTCASAQ